MEKRLDRIEAKLDDVSEHLNSIDTTLAGQSMDLRYHIKRTDDLQIIVMKVNRHVTMVEGAFKFIGILATIVGITLALHQLFK